MISPTTVFEDLGTAAKSSLETVARPPGIGSLLLLSAWCGLIAGLLEVVTIVIRKRLFDSIHLYGMSRHFVWMIPVANVCVFLGSGVLVFAFILPWAHRGRRLFLHALCGLTLLPMMLVAFPQIYGLAWLAVAMGTAMRLVPVVERHPGVFRRLVQVSFPVAFGAVVISAAWPIVGDRIKQSCEDGRPLPPVDSPNVLLIVMDTVAAGHLNLHGYDRTTSTALNELARQGIQFDAAQAASSWTLPSHAVMFTGRWMHELSVGWKTPLERCEHHAGRVHRSEGLRDRRVRGQHELLCQRFWPGPWFHRISRFHLSGATAFKQAVLVSRALAGMQATVEFLEDRLEIARGCGPISSAWPIGSRRSQDSGGRQPRATRLAVDTGAAGAALFRFLELLRRPLPLSTARRQLSPFRRCTGGHPPGAMIEHWARNG